MKQFSTLIFLTILVLSACKSDTMDSKPPAHAEETKMMNKYTLTPFTPSTAYADAKISSVKYKMGKFTFGVEGNGYELGQQTPDASSKMCANSGKGQHIHLIVDNAPYAAKYTSEFDYEIADGEHYILAFLSRSYHESIKTSDAHVAYKTQIKDNGITTMEEVTEPMLHYSRPKGTYVGKKDTEKVMLDFYLNNTSLGTNKVIADINGEKHTLDKWQPYYIEGLPMGDNTITLTLVDGDGNKVDAPLNPVTRTFKLEADPAE